LDDSAPIELSDETLRRLELLFLAEGRELAERWLRTGCGNNLPSMENASAEGLQRIQIAALKVSDGDLEKLREAIRLAQLDWRDLLVAAGFKHDVDAHLKWLPAAR
jgi:hypothetical protein